MSCYISNTNTASFHQEGWGVGSIILVEPSQFSLKCPSQERKVSGQVFVYWEY